ncbi:lactate permease LctP family transporter [Gluconobacter sp. Dm-73]|uniref:lactate permease LctP family transporter n=1 Tax=Gluconobacter sp. Dm-73 TaxID=2799802 RepID=UPI001B8B3551|nr:lactate permease LctP family transporter [Gluconobacter sp. Dm-73]MBS1074808.1 lactate permease LctP family transporter [Gluconobacter sp. Dm-73]
MSSWAQVYDPIGNIWISGAIALIPILFFFFALLYLHMKGHIACTITVGITFALAVLFYGMPVSTAVAAGLYGFAYGLWPISWIIIGAVFLYKISVRTGQFDIIRHSISTVSKDQRIQLLLVAFAFGAFLEGAAGFGAPVAITTALLVGLGFPPIYAGGLCLIANAAPGAFGAMGIPVIVGAQVIGTEPYAVGRLVVMQLILIGIIIPFWLVAVVDGMRGIRETWPVILFTGVVFALTQSLTALLIGPELPDIIAPLVTMVAIPLFLRFWKPSRVFRFDTGDTPADAVIDNTSYTSSQIMRAWSPFIILTAFVAIWSIKPFKALFAAGGPLNWTVLVIQFPGLHNLVLKTAPIVPNPTPYAAIFKLDFISSVGTAILLAGVMTVLFLKMRPTDALATFRDTLRELRIPIYAIGMVLAFAFLANYSGLSTTLALVLAMTKGAFTFFAPLLGWLGVFLTGSDTSSNALFGGLQAATGRQIGVSGELLVAANTVGGAVGKMISPQSIAVASAAVGLVGREGELLHFTLKCSIILAVLVGLITTALVFMGVGA